MPKYMQVLEAWRIDWNTNEPSETKGDAEYPPRARKKSKQLNEDEGFTPTSLISKVGKIDEDYADELTEDEDKREEIKKAHTYMIWKDESNTELIGNKNYVVAPEPPYGGLGKEYLPKDIGVFDASRIDWKTSDESETKDDAEYPQGLRTKTKTRNEENGFKPSAQEKIVGKMDDDYANELTTDTDKRISIKKAHTFLVWRDEDGTLLNGEDNFVNAPEPPYDGLSTY